MSRSYRKTPIVKDCSKHGAKWAKRRANKRVRRISRGLIGKSKLYRKHYERWDICDYWYYYPKSEAIADWKSEEDFKNLFEKEYSKYDWHTKYKSLDDFINHHWKKDWMGK